MATRTLAPSGTPTRPAIRPGGMVGLFAVVGFVGALLLFAIEPLAAKALLPVLGGSPAVWNTAIAFFQLSLLAGYVTAHVTSKWLPARLRVPVQVLILALPILTLPFVLPDRRAPTTSPIWWELVALWTMVGAPFFALSTLSPTAQSWFSRTDHARAHDPFFLYAASNVGSFVGLLSYPLLIEPHLDLLEQADAFRWGYAFLVVLAVASAAVTLKTATPHESRTKERSPIGNHRRLFWVSASAVPSLMLLAVARHIATDVASFPLLWVIPLAIYLGTFILAFSSRSDGATRVAARLFPILAIPGAMATAWIQPGTTLGIGLPLALLTTAGLLAHGRLYASRPGASQVTEFYVWISVGGAVGGLLGALVAPVVFDRIAEYPIAIALSALFLPGSFRLRWRNPLRIAQGVVYVGAVVAAIVVNEFTITALLLGVAGVAAFAIAGHSRAMALLLAGLLAAGTTVGDEVVLVRRRTFFGVYRVLELRSGEHTMISGTTEHGAQLFAPTPQLTPITYYVPDGPIGEFMTKFGSKTEHIGVIGLGTGALASYLTPGQHLTYYEIDPAVVEMATDPRLFTFTRDTRGELDLIVGDGRLTLQRPHEPYGLLMIDAFSSDAIPTHLLTVEAFEAYLRAIEPGGVIGFHISNRHLDLEPVVGRIAKELGLTAVVNDYQSTTPGAKAVTFVAIAPDADDLAGLRPGGWRPIRVGEDLWTDSFSNLLRVIRWS